jgi:hypothetical protein
MMQAAYLDSADPAAVSHAVRTVLERRGALVREAVTSRIQFHSMPTESVKSWTRSGYVGIYQRVGEREVEVRLVLRARWPHRIFWGTAVVDLLVALLAWILQPDGTTWFVLAFLCGLALVIATLLYVNTWRSVREQERAVMADVERELQTENVAPAVVTMDERALLEAEAELEAEVERVRLEKAHRAAPRKPKEKKEKAPREPRAKLAMPKLSIGKKKASDGADKDAELEARKQELLRRKAELEAQGGGDEPKP